MSEGQHVGGVLGFLASLGYLIDMLKPVACVITWEGGGSSRRRAIYPGYKGGRRPQRLNRFHEGEIPDTVENRDWQLGLLIALLRYLPVRQVYVPDCEADDVIGYMARYCFKQNPITIVSSDHDYYQLVNDRVKIWSPNQKKIVDESHIIEKYGIHPINFCVARCFDGDSSDCIPGIPGVGLRTLAKRFPSLSLKETSIDEILEEAKRESANSKAKFYRSIASSEDLLRMNWKLMNLDMTALSATHVKKIEDSLLTDVPQPNKFGMMKSLVKHGIKTFDVERLFLQVNANLK